MAMPAPPPLVFHARPQAASNMLDDNCLDENIVEDAASQQINKSEKNKIELEYLPNGKVHLTLYSSANDFLLNKFIATQSQTIDLSKITDVSLSSSKKLTGATLQLLGERLPSLDSLDLTGCTQFNNSDLAHLVQMPKLTNLALAGCHGIGKAGLLYLSSSLNNIELLDLTQCPQVDDETLACLPNNRHLKHLILTACTQFTNTGLRELGKLNKLESLILDQCTQISDEGLRNLMSDKRLKKLKQINLSNCPHITIQGIMGLKLGIKSLRHINTHLLKMDA